LKTKPIEDIKRFSLLAAIFWSAAILLFICWGLYQVRTSSKNLELNQAKQSLEKDLLFRRWASMHGGVYVPVTEKTPPNPYLRDIPEREIVTPSGRILTLINPAYMTRQVFELASEGNSGLRGHITSLKPHRPGNEPDEWERSALLAFQEQGKVEVSSYEQLDGKPYLRLMRAFYTEQSCLKCHANQGYKLGDIRGGISVSIPLDIFIKQEQTERRTIITSLIIMWLLGIGLIRSVRSRLTQSLQRENSSVNALNAAQVKLFQQEKMASIGQLAAGVAHEINNPMGFVTSNLGTLEKYMSKINEYLGIVESGRDSASARSSLKIDYVLKDSGQLITESLDGATRVKNIVNDLNNLARSDQAEPVLTDLNSCLQSVLNIACNEIKFVADIEKQFGTIPEILCHPQQLSQVFINLLTNAGQAIKGHGSITVRTWSEGEYVYVSVADTGSGIAEEIRARVFDPLFTTKEIGMSAGLGLSISIDIIKKHGGEITVKSEMGVGSTFTVRLPLKPPDQSEMKNKDNRQQLS
jgi:two-component system NtrC family sensor kinase